MRSANNKIKHGGTDSTAESVPLIRVILGHLHFVSLALALLVAFFAGAPAARADDSDDMAFIKSMDLLRVQMKLRALQLLYDAGFFIPQSMVEGYQKEQAQLAQDLDMANGQDLKSVEEWAKETRKVKAVEADEMLKLTEKFCMKVMRGIKFDIPEGMRVSLDAKGEPTLVPTNKSLGAMDLVQFTREMQLQINQWRTQQVKDSLVIARNLEGFASKYNMQAWGTQWELRARGIYEGATWRRKNLVEELAALDKERKFLEQSLVAIKFVDQCLKQVEDFKQSTIDSAYEKAKGEFMKYLNDNYIDLNEENIKWSLDRVKAGIEKGFSAYGKSTDLDKDPYLYRNPTALKAAKGFVAMAAVYDYTIGTAKDFEAMKAFGPLFDVLDFYGQAMGTIPTIAGKVQASVVKIDQESRGVRQLDAFSDLPSATGVWYEPAAATRYHLQLATESTNLTANDLRFTFIVPKDIVPNGQAHLTLAQYDRLAEALACERIIFARGEVWRNAWDFVKAGLYDTPVAPELTASYASGLREKATKTPFKERDILNLAYGQPVEIGGKQWTIESLRTRADTELALLADELCVREGLATYTDDYARQWREYKDLLGQYKLALPPQQIVNLFPVYARSGGSAPVLRRVLQRLVDERTAKRHGVPNVVVPLVCLGDDDTATAGTKGKLVADIIVRNLAPGREVAADITWTLPAELADQSKAGQLKLHNGLNQATLELTFPKKIKPDPLKVVVDVRIPLDSGEVSLTRGQGFIKQLEPAGRGGSGSGAAPLPSLTHLLYVASSATQPVAYRHVKGRGEFDVDLGEGGPLQIVVRRLDDLGANGIEITSEALGGLDEQPGRGLRFALYRGEHPAGTLVEMERQAQFVPAGEKLKTKTETGRLAKDKYLIVDDPHRGWRDDKPGRGPLIYQVREVYTDRDGQPAGKETKSNITKPGKPFIRVMDEMTADGQLKLFPAPDLWANIKVALSLEDQQFDAVEASFTAQSGNWKGYFVSGRREGDRSFGYESISEGPTGSVASLKVPYHPEGGDVTISATNGMFTATRTLKLPVDEKLAASRRARVADIRKGFDQAMANHKDKLDGSRKGLALEEAKPEKDRDQDFIARLRGDILMLERYSMPAQPCWTDYAAAEAGTDWPAALRAAQQKVPFVKVQFDVLAENLAAQEAVYRWRTTREGATDGDKERLAKWKADYPKAVADNHKAETFELEKAYGVVAYCAVLAGDAGAYREGRNAQLRAELDMNWSPGTMGGLVYNVADELAMLTGDRKAAAPFRLAGEELYVQSNPEADRAARRADMERGTRPAWFPSGLSTTRPVEIKSLLDSAPRP